MQVRPNATARYSGRLAMMGWPFSACRNTVTPIAHHPVEPT
jgi:hypothetical protein